MSHPRGSADRDAILPQGSEPGGHPVGEGDLPSDHHHPPSGRLVRGRGHVRGLLLHQEEGRHHRKKRLEKNLFHLKDLLKLIARGLSH